MIAKLITGGSKSFKPLLTIFRYKVFNNNQTRKRKSQKDKITLLVYVNTEVQGSALIVNYSLVPGVRLDAGQN